jgi:2-oxoglutarate dehydrogenase E1 component
MGKLGQNRGYVDELYASYRADPASVSAAWREFFADYQPETRHEERAAEPAKPARPSAATPLAQDGRAEPLEGPAARIARNMAASLSVPTATSSRTIPVKMLEEHRRIVNQHQETIAGPKISFTHLIAWAIVRALERHPEMTARYVEIEGVPHRVPGGTIRLGLAIDVERGGERLLLVPNVKDAGVLDFPSFVAAYDDLVARARRNELAVSDFEGTTVTLTNPGMIGTSLSVPRLMEGQGAIVGVGAIGYPAEYAGMSAEVISELGLSKVMTVTSTYDHRVIQGAASGAFLATLDSLLQGGHGLYKRIFLELGVPHEPIAWECDHNPQLLAAGAGSTAVIAKQAGVLQLIRSYRVRGHLWADLDPLGYRPEPNRELELSHYGLTVWDLDRQFIAGGLAGENGTLKLREILDTCEQTYCRHVGVEYMHIQDTDCRQWLQQRMERTRNQARLEREERFHVLRRLNAADAFETFLGTNYVGQKRFSLEGAETLIPMLDFLLSDAAAAGTDEVVIGMTHRGRLNVLANIIGKSYGQIFREFEGDVDPRIPHGSGDVKYHLGCTGTFRAADGREIRVRVASNPSHLEAVDPVVEGMVRAFQDRRGDTTRATVLPVLIHGDAAFSGQGVVAETLNLSDLKGYRTGGTVHVVVNNQIGFTTGPAEARSSHYSTDVAKMLRAPIFHVNGDHPEDAVRVIRLAFAFRQEFKRDVVVDLVCYRRWGHNEADDPSYTHPILYAKIEKHRSVRKLYTERLMRNGDLDVETAERALEDFRRRLEQVHDEVQRTTQGEGQTGEAAEIEIDLDEPADDAWRPPDTGVERGALERVLAGLDVVPDGFVVHPKLAKQLARRRERFDGGGIDWALAETLSFGSLVLEGTPVRLSGEDSARGTFSQRHATLFDFRTSEPYVPLAHLAPDQAPFHAFDSLLSEFAVLGFEYGYSVGHPDALVLWEAQFGDFVNGAQVILDQFLVSAERKWGQTSGVVLLLPHGYEGQGPEHSSARLERFLQLAARGNLRVAQPSTPAQYFHLLRAQARTAERKPLVVMTPKSLLRHKACVSRSEELARGRFEPVLDDGTADGAERLLLCTGKIWYDLDAERQESGTERVSICRLERLYPFPSDELGRVIDRHGPSCRVSWVQEEPRNMGAWSFVRDRVEPMLGPKRALEYVGRPADASPATGSHRRHVAEQTALVRRALATKTAKTADAPAR